MRENDLVSDRDIDERSVNEIKSLLNERVNEIWQTRWDTSLKGRVTYEFVKDVRFAGRNKWFNPSLRVGYIITGHGTLNAWLYERELAESPACLCGSPREDWVHVLWVCGLYESFRRLYNMGVSERVDGTLDVSGVLSTRGTYECLCAFIERAYRMRVSVAARMAEDRNER